LELQRQHTKEKEAKSLVHKQIKIKYYRTAGRQQNCIQVPDAPCMFHITAAQRPTTNNAIIQIIQ